MKYSTLNAFFASVMSLAFTALAQPVAAQVENNESKADGSAGTVCMTRPLGDVPQVTKERRGQAFQIITTEEAVPSMEAKGFTRIECEKANSALTKESANYRDEMCQLAATGNEAVQNQLARAMGAKPSTLCASAKEAVEQQKRKQKTTKNTSD